MSEKKHGQITDSTIARIAGNIFGTLQGRFTAEEAARMAVEAARAIAAEVERTRNGA